MIAAEKWRWYGLAGHLIVSARCRFHLCTVVGKYIVSTVGAYYQKGEDKKPTEIGAGRLYETFVFKVGKGECDCGCGLPSVVDWSEIDADSYNDARAANEGHLKMCRKYARKLKEGA